MANGLRAKYIEGLENRLGRMESLLRLSGLLSEEDDGSTDLGTLEKRLAEKQATSNGAPSSKDSVRSTPAANRDGSVSAHGTPQVVTTSPQSAVGSPEPAKEKDREEVEALSDMMCSLVTNNNGETKYIGPWTITFSIESMG